MSTAEREPSILESAERLARACAELDAAIARFSAELDAQQKRAEKRRYELSNACGEARRAVQKTIGQFNREGV